MYISLCKACDPREGIFWPQGHNLNKLSRVPLVNASNQVSRRYALWFSDKKMYSYFPYISICKQCYPKVGPF